MKFNLFILAQKNSLGGGLTTMDTYYHGLQKVMERYGVGEMVFRQDSLWKSRSLDKTELDDGLEQAKTFGANFVLLILNRKSNPIYSAFTDLVDRNYGFHSLCITEAPNWKFAKDQKFPNCKLKPSATKSVPPNEMGQYLGNVAMKVNLKASGTKHFVPDVPKGLEDTLVLEADVTHPSPGFLIGCPSIAAIVGSVDAHCGKFLGSMRLQRKDKKEMIDDVTEMVRERIHDWATENKRLPANILYYRDGVRDGQYAQVKAEELPKICHAFDIEVQAGTWKSSSAKLVSKTRADGCRGSQTTQCSILSRC
ncbi:ribonuclease H-like domain-containing protein [Clohesyomyces aquaticus]|uniref:Ribonuclease H-like domain-containing protein n=1 Tax=Clohesyomyces aquaticus TaxID=1231657 RepID=A0A1Y1Z9S6_9PLEO|nr:ribonuclease H-like domain-containing protein [Clohesyomyces aquaticus]